MAVFLPLLPGCPKPNEGISAGGRLEAPLGSISVHELAGALDLTVVKSSHDSALLRGPQNTVMIFADPGGQAYVNGKRVGSRGGVVPVSGMLFVPRRMATPIRSALRPRRVRPPKPAGQRHKGLKIVIDPGHGGRQIGTPVAAPLYEKTVNLSVAKRVAQKLREHGLDVTMTRSRDRTVSLDERVAIANRVRGRLFVSIHADSFHRRSVEGFTVFMPRRRGDRSLSRFAATALVRRLAATGAVNRGARTHWNNLRVLEKTACPAVLIELGFLSNRAEAKRLARSDYQDRLAEAICSGVLDFLDRR